MLDFNNPEQIAHEAAELAAAQEIRLREFAKTNGRHRAGEFFARPVELNCLANIQHYMAAYHTAQHRIKTNTK